MVKKKKYNPFKMWGSYIGSLLGLLLILISFWYAIRGDWNSCSGAMGVLICIDGSMMFSIGLMLAVVGFLIGWGIHSLIRRFKK